MAVRPTDDRSLDDPPADSAPSWLYYCSAALAVVVVVCLGVLVFLFVHDTDSDDSAGDRLGALFGHTDAGSPSAQAADLTDERNAAIAVADQFVLRLNDYGPHDLDAQNTMPGYVQRVDAVVSAKLRAGFEQSVKLAEQSVAQTGYGRTAQLFGTGVSSIDSDSATVLVAGTFTSSYPDKSHPADASKRTTYEPVPFRYQIPMVMVDGGWRVDDFVSVTDGTDAGASSVPDYQGQAPGTAPTGTPTIRPTSKPSTKPDTKPSTKSTKGAGR